MVLNKLAIFVHMLVFIGRGTTCSCFLNITTDDRFFSYMNIFTIYHRRLPNVVATNFDWFPSKTNQNICLAYGTGLVKRCATLRLNFRRACWNNIQQEAGPPS